LKRRRAAERELAAANVDLELRVQARTRALETTESKLREQLALTRLLTEHTQVCLLLVDFDLRITYANAAAERITGYSRSDLVGHRLQERLRPSRADNPIFPARQASILAMLAKGEPLLDHEDEFVHQDGTRYPVRCNLHPVFSHGMPIGAVLEIRDISAERQHVAEREQALEREHHLRREAEAASRAKDEFFAMLGHELRNPLAPIQTALQLMRIRGAGNQRERAVIERQMKHVVALVDDLLDVTRITRGKVELHLKRVAIADVVARAVETVQPLLEQRAHSLTVNVPAEPCDVMGDPERLAQVFANLLTNAAKYTERGGRIAVIVEGSPKAVTIRVRDSGIGILPEVLPRIFDLFTQEAQALDRRTGGLGLGLAIVRSLVSLHHGTVEASSEGRGRGSEFIVRLPRLSPKAYDTEDRDGERESRPPGNPVRVLVVDDNEDAADVLAEALLALGHIVEVAHDAPNALEIAARFEPQVVLADIGLPVMDGYELAQRFAEDPLLKSTKLVAVTGYGQEDDRRRAEAAGFVEHLVKPVDVDVVHALIARLTHQGAKDETGANHSG
jgi:PAS domain S-box-containing protein